jgi:hypothetical protein
MVVGEAVREPFYSALSSEALQRGSASRTAGGGCPHIPPLLQASFLLLSSAHDARRGYSRAGMFP